MTITERIMIFGLILELLSVLPTIETDVEGAVGAWHQDTTMDAKLKDAGAAAASVASAIAKVVEGQSTAGTK